MPMDALLSNSTFLSLDMSAARFERLKAAVRDYDRSATIHCAGSMKDAFTILHEKKFAVILVTPDFEEYEIENFIRQATDTPGGEDAAIILLISAKDSYEIEEQMSIGLLIGANGFLMEPFSVDGVRDTIALAQSVQTDRLSKRQKQGIKLCLGPARRLIDRTATLLRMNDSYRPVQTEVENTSKSIERCVEENSDLYFRVLVGSFIRLCKERDKSKIESYSGSSPRVRKMVAQKLLDEEAESNT